jgi:hypothetical protein
MWWMCFVPKYEGRTMKPVEIVHSGGGRDENDGGVNISDFKHM